MNQPTYELFVSRTTTIVLLLCNYVFQLFPTSDFSTSARISGENYYTRKTSEINHLFFKNEFLVRCLQAS